MGGQPQSRRLRPGRVVVYILVALLAFALAAGVGAVAAMMLGGEPGSTGSENSPLSEEQGNAQHSEKQGEAKGSSRQNEEQDSAQQTEKHGRSQQSEADYVSEVG